MEKVAFERIEDDQGKLSWVAARQKSAPWHVFVWVPNTRRWHRMRELEAGPAYVEGVRMVGIGREEAEALIADRPKLDSRSWSWLLDEFAAQPRGEIRLSAQLGVREARPLTGLSVDDLPEDGSWVEVAAFASDADAPARSLASDLRTGKRAGFPAGSTQALVQPADERIVVSASRMSATA
ncbi:hypothetical protein SPF06_18615 [Sinomonas sp. JGH33]|uniref:Uncharacterized protein n=1 Tax=Sinomonas terricola TaxID=3110330 RepID=A0ABU5TCE6_9MICC|nr:hypothetical protein [Sinomonas sp. JGH33]MEA5456741.1 hypothetical protein [Sinomonas sp. JGH33]